MKTSSQVLTKNARLLKAKASRHAIYGVLIAFGAIIIATLLSSYFQYGALTIENFYQAQKNNTALWLLDAMPFFFAFWGQYTSSIMAYEAGALVLDQTHELRTRTSDLEIKVMRNATYDSLTNLPNRFLLLDRLEQAISNTRYGDRKIGLFILNLNQFKEINETLGHESGDQLLKQVAVRLSEVIHDPRVAAMRDFRDAHPELLVLAPTLVADHFAVRTFRALIVERDLALNDHFGRGRHHKIIGFALDDFAGTAGQTAGQCEFVYGPVSAVGDFVAATNPDIRVGTQRN